MTTPTHLSAMPPGGIPTQHVDQDYADYNAGRPLTQRVCIEVLQAAGIASRNQEKGRKKETKYETVRLVEVTDPHEADKLRHLLMQFEADRGLRAKQPALFDLTEAEQVESLRDMIFDHASENDIARKNLDAEFVTYFGGREHASAESVQACRSVVQLKEFALHIGALADTVAGEDSNGAPAGKPAAEPDDEATPAASNGSAAKKATPKQRQGDNVVPFEQPDGST